MWRTRDPRRAEQAPLALEPRYCAQSRPGPPRHGSQRERVVSSTPAETGVREVESVTAAVDELGWREPRALPRTSPTSPPHDPSGKPGSSRRGRVVTPPGSGPEHERASRSRALDGRREPGRPEPGSRRLPLGPAKSSASRADRVQRGKGEAAPWRRRIVSSRARHGQAKAQLPEEKEPQGPDASAPAGRSCQEGVSAPGLTSVADGLPRRAGRACRRARARARRRRAGLPACRP